MKTTTQDDDRAFQRLYPMLDQAIDDLRTSDREVIVRRYLEGQSFTRIGQALGISEDAAQKRTSRAFEQLNRFFKRKAGITVSSAVLAAGISQHCVEAAPASCLSILGKTAVTGAASGITSSTIITIMGTNKIAAIASGIVLLGTVTFVATRDGSPSENVSSPPLEIALPPLPSIGENATARTRSAKRPVVRDARSNAGDAADYSPNKELARLEAMNQHPGKDEFARRLAVKHEQMLKELTDDLSLSTAQIASVKQALDSRLKLFRAALDTGPQPGDSGQESLLKEQEMIFSAGEIVQGVGLRDDLKGILSADQLTTFDVHETKAWQKQVESHTYTEFSKIAPALALTEEQKDRVFALLKASSEETLRADGAERAFMAMQKGQATAQIDMPDLGETKFMIETMVGLNQYAPGSPEFVEQLMQVVGDGIDEQVELLAPVLDERQKQLYREHLALQNILSDPSIKLPEPE